MPGNFGIPGALMLPVTGRTRVFADAERHGVRQFAAAFLLLPIALLLHAWSNPAHAQTPLPGGVRLTPLAPAGSLPPGFTRMAPAVTGIRFTNTLSELFALNNQILENGAGVALGDVDGDGRCDIYLCGSEGDNALFLNQGGWRFTDATVPAGVACKGQFSTGCALADVDGDGDLDLLVNGLGVGTRLFLNDGRARFTESSASGLRRNGAATSLALHDLDGDGDLDLYVCQYRSSSIRGEDQPPAISARIVDGKAIVTPADRFLGFPRADGTVELVEKGEPDRLYWNDGKGKFSLASWTNGVFLDEQGRVLTAPPEEWSLCVSLRDLNGDGHPDIYVCNDFFRSRDELWLGDGRGHFRAAGPEVLRGFPLSSMSIDVADVDRDGTDDFFVAEMLARSQASRRVQRANAPRPGLELPLFDPAYRIEHGRNALQRGRGDGTFADITWLSGLAATDWTWSAVFLDVDLDGWEDLLVATGNAHDVLDMDAQGRIDQAGAARTAPLLSFYPPLEQPNLAFRNNGDLTFTETGTAWGFNERGISQAMALGDLDGDGDADVVVNNLNREPSLHRNNAAAHRIAIRLHGPSPNTAGVGARIAVSNAPGSGVPATQSQVVIAGGRYLSSDQPLRTFALGTTTNTSVQVRWPDGRLTRLDSIPANHLCEIFAPTNSPSAASVAQDRPAIAPALFTNVSRLLGHIHVENSADIAAGQALLPARLDAPGPGVAWIDWDGDGWDDLAIGGSEGGRIAVLRNDTKGGFQPVRAAGLDASLRQDASMVLGHRTAAGLALLANATHGADGSPAKVGVRIVGENPPDGTPVAVGWGSSTGPMALADVDGDGDLDLFIGGRLIPGRWPEPASSRLLLQKDGQFLPDSGSTNLWARVGMVSGAVFSDLDDDGDPDLALACEWGPIRVFRNERGKFSAWEVLIHAPGARPNPAAHKLSLLTGRWTGITSADFNGDGRPDLVVGNWGRNTREHAARDYELWSGDFTGLGGVEILETVVDPATGRRIPWRARDELVNTLPWIAELFPTYRAFAEAEVAQVLAGRATKPNRLPLIISDSIVLLGRADGFDLRPLPLEAQFTPAFGLAVSDFDGDGHEDLFLAQNFFRTEPETSRLDAGRGLVLQGDGRGGFRPLPGTESGILIPGEQRGAAVADFDQDGRPDLAVGQNNGPTQLLRNQSGRPGLRVRLAGPAGNPTAVGARLRLQNASGSGTAREIHAGSGYLSQDSSVHVLAAPDTAQTLEVRWPGGPTRGYPVPAGATTLDVRFDP